MTTRYIGMNRNTGRTITDADHISQSMSDILRTPVGSRVMRRDYGSLLSSLIDQPQTPTLTLQPSADVCLLHGAAEVGAQRHHYVADD